MRVPRCEICKLRHNLAVDGVGRQWARRQSWPLLLSLVCAGFVCWMLPGVPGWNSFLIILLVWVVMGLPIFGLTARFIDMTFPRHRIMARMLAPTKPPAACLLFPPLAGRLYGDWNAYVSPYCLYGNWYGRYQMVRGLTLNRSLNDSQPRCYPATEHLFKLASDDLSSTTMATISRQLSSYEEHASAVARERAGADAAGPSISALLRCIHCARSFDIGKDSVRNVHRIRHPSRKRGSRFLGRTRTRSGRPGVIGR